jgi:CRISPR-associated protein Csc1
MKLYKCLLEPHDFLFFVSRDLAKIGITEKTIHNTALNYAINYTSRIISFSSQPDYNDIKDFRIRVTPAHPVNTVSEIGLSYNAVNDLDQSTAPPYQLTKNYPTFGKYYKIDLGAVHVTRGKKNFEYTKFEFFALSFGDLPPRRVVRLGKKDNCCVVRFEELLDVRIRETSKQNIVRPSHPINPLEFEGDFALDSRFPIVLLSIPPHHLVTNCGIENGKYLKAKGVNGKRYNIFPPKDRLNEVITFYGSN